MERKDETVALIDLGAASTETKGHVGLIVEFVSMMTAAGLTDED